MRRPRIKTALIGIFSFISLLFAGFAGIFYDSITRVEDSASVVAEKSLPSVSYAKQIAIEFITMRVAIAGHLLAASPAEFEAVEKQIAEDQARVTKAIEAYRPLAESEQEKALLATISSKMADFDKWTGDVTKLSRGNLFQPATDLIRTKLTPAGQETLDAIGALVAFNEAAADETMAVSAKVYNGVMFIGGGLAALIAAGLATSMIFITRSVANPILRITGAMKALAEGDTGIAVPFSGRADEIGSMAAAVETFRQAAISNIALERDSARAREQAEADRLATQARAEAEAADRLRLATSGLAAGIKRLSDGDLAFELSEPFAPDFEPLRHDFNASVRQLGTTLSAMSNGIVAIDSGTREIASGANDLSRRTEQQAAALEETAAALDEITVNVANASKRTEEARHAATEANRSAARSGAVVSQAEEAMRRIETSSQQISNIIGVIDEIAFQTNLLALNAGVEAARAGEAGKGFAVVAQEVRELAQRSATAAKEIKALIQTSTTEVDGGVRLVRETGVALKEISEHIAGINQHMEAIATSAREQSSGLAEVNGAINAMDQTTQQNAAMVEQSTAASATLATEAARLAELVAQFKLAGTVARPSAVSQASALRATARSMAEAQLAPARSSAQAAPVARKQASAASAARATATAPADNWEEF